MEIKSLGKTDFDIVFEAFNRAFADYEIQLNKEQLQMMLKRRGFDPELSFAAFEKGGIVAFTFNGIGNFGGMPTAYDTGTGTLKEYRGKGYGKKLLETAIQYLNEKQVEEICLTVIEQNDIAYKMYKKRGFKVYHKLSDWIELI